MNTNCMSCKVANGVVVPGGGLVLKTESFNVAQDVEYMIPGFMILASNRHFKSFDEMSNEELSEFSKLLAEVRGAQREALGIEDVYYFYNEDTRHHFHLWMIPRLDWMKQFGRSIESVSPMLAHAKLSFVSSEHKDEVLSSVLKMQNALAKKN